MKATCCTSNCRQGRDCPVQQLQHDLTTNHRHQRIANVIGGMCVVGLVFVFVAVKVWGL